ncbi:hypothetical protein [Corynebacterium variabile]|uniref:hypothetical protein n=1 Tax=Corynebacterium variabile TaxID=1727 RepID=UPI0009EDEC43|nr:hypothetical protein [Corynebacterium variabile]
MTQRILVDANVIVSKTQFDWLFHLRQLNPGMFQIHSTYDIFAEALKALRRDIPSLPGRVIAQRVEMIQDCVDEVLQDFSGGAFLHRGGPERLPCPRRSHQFAVRYDPDRQ